MLGNKTFRGCPAALWSEAEDGCGVVGGDVDDERGGIPWVGVLGPWTAPKASGIPYGERCCENLESTCKCKLCSASGLQEQVRVWLASLYNVAHSQNRKSYKWLA